MMTKEQGETMSEDVSWLNHAVGAAFAAVGTFGLMVAGAFARLWRHEERIKALEDSAQARSAALTSLADKVDTHHSATVERIDSMSAEIRADLRVIQARCFATNHEDR